MAWSESFPPSVSSTDKILILGSMPGVRSLQAQEYYAHPRNAFWAIMKAMFDIDTALPYPQRLELLNQHGVGLWDVYRRCYRPGSLDADIDGQTVYFNDIASLLECSPQLRVLVFNGKASESGFHRYLKTLEPVQKSLFDDMRFEIMPSTSPAYAAISAEKKCRHWMRLKDFLEEDA